MRHESLGVIYYDSEGVAYVTTGEFRMPRKGEPVLYTNTFAVDNRAAAEPVRHNSWIVRPLSRDLAGRALYERENEFVRGIFPGIVHKSWDELGPQHQESCIARALIAGKEMP